MKRHQARTAFTLIELLVVVAIIALLISILLPSLHCAREQAKTAKCGVQLRGLGMGLHNYATEERDWLPGVNTSGVATEIAARNGADALRRPHIPVQTWDWLTPLLRYETEMPATRAGRFGLAINYYQCPSMTGQRIDFLFPQGLSASPDRADFVAEEGNKWSPLSYLMPVHFQYWGRQYQGQTLADPGGSRPEPVLVKVANVNWEAYHTGGYQSKIDQVGIAGRKVAIADGTRYVTAQDQIDFDVNPTPTWFGSFTTSGAWWAGAQEYGVRTPSVNWDGDPVTASNGGPEAPPGKNLVWSYRHGCGIKETLPRAAQDNKGTINAVFFDGHVERLTDRASRNHEFWYPSGAVVRIVNEGMTTVPQGFEIP